MVTKNLFSCIRQYKSLLCSKYAPSDFSDHTPVSLELDINVNYFSESKITNEPSTAWHKCTKDHKIDYSDNLDSLLLRINIQHESLTCNNIQCNRHKDSIITLYTEICNSILSADECLPNTGNPTNTPNVVAGWNEFVEEHKQESLAWHQCWLEAGRPNQGLIALKRRLTRAKYHYAIRFVQKEENRIKSNRMAEAMVNNQDRILWKEVKKNNSF